MQGSNTLNWETEIVEAEPEEALKKLWNRMVMWSNTRHMSNLQSTSWEYHQTENGILNAMQKNNEGTDTISLEWNQC